MRGMRGKGVRYGGPKLHFLFSAPEENKWCREENKWCREENKWCGEENKWCREENKWCREENKWCREEKVYFGATVVRGFEMGGGGVTTRPSLDPSFVTM